MFSDEASRDFQFARIVTATAHRPRTYGAQVHRHAVSELIGRVA